MTAANPKTPKDPNSSSVIENFAEDLGQPVEEKMAFVERALYSYLKRIIFGGIKTLQSPGYRMYFWYVILILIATITAGLLHQYDKWVTAEILQIVLVWGVASSGALFLTGLIGGLFNKAIDFFGVIFIIVATIVAILFPQIYTNVLMQWFKIGIFLIWTAISAISIFYIILYFHTSFYYRLVTMGISANRLFLQPFLRIGVWATFGLNVYLFTRDSPSAQILGLVGMVISWVLLMILYRTPTTYSKDDFPTRETKAAKMIFAQVVGFYNFYLIYHLSQSYSTGSTIGNILVELVLLTLNTLYIINNLAQKVERIQDLDAEQDKLFHYQVTSKTFMTIKKKMGEKSLILIALGIAAGYYCITLDSYLGLNAPLFQELLLGTDLSLPVIYHRGVILISFGFILLSLLSFYLSRSYREMFINRYTLRHTLKMFTDLFRKGDDGSPSAVTEAMALGKEKVAEFGQKLKDRLFGNLKPKKSSRNDHSNPSNNSDQMDRL